MQSWIAAFILLSPLTAFGQAGGSGGNGGDAVAEGRIIDRVQNGFQLLDFRDAGLKDEFDLIKSLQINFYNSVDPEKIRLRRDVGKMVEVVLNEQDDQQSLVSLIGQEDPLLARILAAPFAMYNWTRQSQVTYVDDYTNINDYSVGTPYRYGDGIWRVRDGVHQVGRRILDQIEISEPVFPRMYQFDRLGLLIHESIYALSVKAPELPYGQDPLKVRTSVANWFKHRLGLSSVNPLETDQFEFNKLLSKARALLIPGEVLEVKYERGQYYQIVAQNFVIEFVFEDYKTLLFDTKYLQPRLIVK